MFFQKKRSSNFFALHGRQAYRSVVFGLWHQLILILCVFYCAVVSEEGQALDGNYGGNGIHILNEAERHLIKHRELYLTRQIETFKIDMVR